VLNSSGRDARFGAEYSVMENMDFSCGVQLVKEKISEEVLTMFMPPVPTPSEQIPLAAGLMIVQVAAGE